MAQKEYDLDFFKEAQKEFDRLDGSQKIFVNKALQRIRNQGMQAGVPLSGALEGCNKLKHRKLGLRIVFRQAHDQVQIIQIIAIGKRDSFEVYRDAEIRLAASRKEH